MGVTGERDSAGRARPRDGPSGCKAVTDKPVLLGVGISTPEQAVEARGYADGVIVGSALVARLLRGGGPDGAHAFVARAPRVGARPSGPAAAG